MIYKKQYRGSWSSYSKKKTYVDDVVRLNIKRVLHPTKFDFGEYLDKKKRAAYLFVNRRRKNFFLTLTDLNGSVICCITSGFMKYRRRARLSPPAIQAVSRKTLSQAIALGISHLDIILIVKSKYFLFTLLRYVKMYGFAVSRIYDNIPIPHNGCKKKKSRRI